MGTNVQMPTTQENSKALEELAKNQLEEDILRYKKFAKLQPEHPFTVANKHMLNLTEEDTWAATGTLEMTGVLWWALSLQTVLDGGVPDGHGPAAVVMNAKGGPDANFSVVACAVQGSYYVDPSKLNHKDCFFTLDAVAGIEGGISISMYSTDKVTWFGKFTGVAEGLALVNLSADGELMYSD